MAEPSNVSVGIVDDSEDLRLVLRLTLQSDGRFDVLGEAGDGEAAIHLVEESRPDLLVLDLAMPGMDGMSALRRLRASCDEDPVVVVLSAYPSGGWAARAYEAGADGYLQKGGDPTAMADSIFRAWQRAGRGGPRQLCGQ